MEWSDVSKLDDIWLNLGGRGNCHPRPGYENYIAVDLEPATEGWAVKQDLRQPLPLADGSVSRILTEDFVEHIRPDELSRLFAECYRVLKPGGYMRIACPDYNNPKDRHAFDNCEHDIRNPLHITRTDYPMMKALLEATPFKDIRFYHYWDGDTFVQKKIDYNLGPVKRTPDNDQRCHQDGLARKFRVFVSDLMFKLTHLNGFSEAEFLARKGHRLYITSIVVDLYR
jgi:predicted SAM-dependent methyltransferase